MARVHPEPRASEPSVLATVVTYQPGPDLRANLAALRAQVDRVVVVDNGSTDVALVREAAAAEDCMLVASPTNDGVATALNTGLQVARDCGATWFATFDQDSLLPPGAMAALLRTWAAHPDRDRIGMVAVAHQDRGTGRDYHHRLDILREEIGTRWLRTTITSGSMVRMDVVDRIGGFEDRLFIDAVDHEFCLRLRRAGWSILEDCTQVMPHSIGHSTVHRLLGLRVVCTHHSPRRRYYMTRNHLEVGLRNLFFDPAWALKTMLQVASGNVAALLYEDARAAKLAMMARGLADFALRRFGPRA